MLIQIKLFQSDLFKNVLYWLGFQITIIIHFSPSTRFRMNKLFAILVCFNSLLEASLARPGISKFYLFSYISVYLYGR
jgi:hypothetical protein